MASSTGKTAAAPTMAEMAPRLNSLIEKLENGEIDLSMLWKYVMLTWVRAWLPLLEDREIRSTLLELQMLGAPFLAPMKGKKIFFQTSATDPVCVEPRIGMLTLLGSSFIVLGDKLPIIPSITTWVIRRLIGREPTGSSTGSGQGPRGLGVRLIGWLIPSGLTRWFLSTFVVKLTPITESDIKRENMPGCWIDTRVFSIILEEGFPKKRGPGLTGEGGMAYVAILDQWGLIRLRRFPQIVRWLGGWEKFLSSEGGMAPALDDLIFRKGSIARLEKTLPPHLDSLLKKYGC